MNAGRSDARGLGFSDCMGPQLRNLVERKLPDDLGNYLLPENGLILSDLRFDWSDSCVEGHRTYWLDGEIENFSGIAIFDLEQNLIAEGWMEFIETEAGLEVFWWFLRGPTLKSQGKESNEVPTHIWDRLSDELRHDWSKFAPTSVPMQ
jgi:hypothetical protein